MLSFTCFRFPRKRPRFFELTFLGLCGTHCTCPNVPFEGPKRNIASLWVVGSQMQPYFFISLQYIDIIIRIIFFLSQFLPHPPAVESTLVEAGATYSQNRVVKDGNIITSRGPGLDFGYRSSASGNYFVLKQI